MRWWQASAKHTLIVALLRVLNKGLTMPCALSVVLAHDGLGPCLEVGHVSFEALES